MPAVKLLLTPPPPLELFLYDIDLAFVLLLPCVVAPLFYMACDELRMRPFLPSMRAKQAGVIPELKSEFILSIGCMCGG